MTPNQIYTKSERTVKKYTVGYAVARVRERLKAKGIERYCCNYLAQNGLMDLKEKVTLQQVNEIIEAVYGDSVYYNI
jgi:hypothetical protein